MSSTASRESYRRWVLTYGDRWRQEPVTFEDIVRRAILFLTAGLVTTDFAAGPDCPINGMAEGPQARPDSGIVEQEIRNPQPLRRIEGIQHFHQRQGNGAFGRTDCPGPSRRHPAPTPLPGKGPGQGVAEEQMTGLVVLTQRVAGPVVLHVKASPRLAPGPLRFAVHEGPAYRMQTGDDPEPGAPVLRSCDGCAPARHRIVKSVGG